MLDRLKVKMGNLLARIKRWPDPVKLLFLWAAHVSVGLGIFIALAFAVPAYWRYERIQNAKTDVMVRWLHSTVVVVPKIAAPDPEDAPSTEHAPLPKVQTPKPRVEL